MVKTIFGTVFIVLVLAILAIAALWFYRLPMAEWAIETAAARAGYKDVSLRVAEIDLSKVTLKAMTLNVDGKPSVQIDQAEATYSWRSLLKTRKVDTLTIGPGVIGARLNEDLTLEVAGQRIPLVADGTATTRRAEPIHIPAGRITIRPLTLDVQTPGGPVTGVLSGAFAPQSGGSLMAQLTGAAAGLSTVSVSDIDARLDITVDREGAFSLSGDLAGGLSTPIGTVRALQLTASGAGAANWDAARSTLNGWTADVEVDLASAAMALARESEAELAVIDAINTLNQMMAIGGDGRRGAGQGPDQVRGDPLGEITLSGALALTIGHDGVRTIAIVPGGALTARNDRDEHIIIEPHTDALFSATAGERRLSFRPDLRTRWLTTSATLTLTELGDGGLNIEGDLTLPAQSFALLGGEGQAEIDAMQLIFTGNRTGSRYFLSVVPVGTIRTIRRQPLALKAIRLTGQPIDVTYFGEAPSGVPVLTVQMAQRASASNGAGRDRQPCMAIGETLIRLAPEALLMRVDDAQVCPTGRPLISLSTLEPLQARVAAVISASRIEYQHGDASLRGRPPTIRLNGQWDSAAQALAMSGDFTGGRAVLNETLGLSETDGRIQAEIRGEALSAKTVLNNILIQQVASPEMVAPVRANGVLTYTDDVAEFSADISTPDTIALGAVRGQHNINEGAGDLGVDFAALTFLPDGLQPLDILPGLQGIIANATGVVDGEARFSWQLDQTAAAQTGDGADALTLTSSAVVRAENLTFTGPGRAVTATGGVTGTAKFVDLLPARSDGVQTLKIGLIDLDAIRLEDGTAEIEFPGDDTVRVIKGEFPWFGGTLGAYDTVAALTGETVTTALRAQEIDLGAFLTFLDIPGLSGEGTVDGALPIIVEEGRIRVENAVLRATRPGVIRFDSQVTNEIAKASDETQFAFDILRELTFDTFEATINGALDGQLTVGLVFEGTNAVTINNERVPAPVIYRITLEGPLPSLISQRLQFSNFSFTPVDAGAPANP
ncbi:MAG: YdbH domain-containing protein [Pseudomonadota bacterium]